MLLKATASTQHPLRAVVGAETPFILVAKHNAGLKKETLFKGKMTFLAVGAAAGEDRLFLEAQEVRTRVCGCVRAGTTNSLR